MRTSTWMHRGAMLSLLALASVLASCATPPVGSPEWNALARQYEMGCRPEYAEGYEKFFEYCHRR
jgi:hypothetical protein